MDARFQKKHLPEFHSLLGFLARVPAIKTNQTPWGEFSTGYDSDENWWVDFEIDIRNPIAWHVVQEFGFVLNMLSVEERLSAVFKPVSPPPYLNGGPEEFLSWMIESRAKEFTPKLAQQWLESRLTRSHR